MIRKLQIKLIAATMLSLTVVLAVIVGAANLVNYHKIITDADVTLAMLAANQGGFPEGYEEWSERAILSSPELPYETRYFYIVLDAEGVKLTETVALSWLVQEEAASFQTLAATQNKMLTYVIEPDITIRGDEKSLRRLVGILLDNALKYSPENGNITVMLKAQYRSVRLTVRNTAVEMKRENLPRLFERFYRTDESRNSKTGGYGLGLSIAASTVKAHKGKITASSEDEKSLTITVTLPS